MSFGVGELVKRVNVFGIGQQMSVSQRGIGKGGAVIGVPPRYTLYVILRKKYIPAHKYSFIMYIL